MNFRNSSIYVQRQTDRLLRDYRDFIKTYVNDIVMFNKTLNEHLKHLIKVFNLFERINIAIKFFKIYLDYSSVTLLNQKMNSLELIIAKEKLKIISKLRFSITLKLLKSYLELTGWMRNYVSYYAQLSNLFQIRKINMLRSSSINDDNARKRFNASSRFDIFTEAEQQFYKALQEVFNKFIFLIHHDFARQLYADVNASHERDFEVIVYHVKNDKSPDNYIKQDIELILFLSKIFISAESRYWSIELKTAGFIWLIRKIRHMIEAARSTPQIIIYTDHSATINIVKQIKFTFNNIDKLNLRLVRASTYLLQFSLDVRHKSSKQHIIFDVLSRLSSNVDAIKRANDLEGDENTLNATYHVILIKMSDDFKSRLKQIYAVNKRWARIIELIKFITVGEASDEDSPWTSFEKLRFRYRDELIYYLNDNDLNDGRERLCVFKKMAGEIFVLAHDRLSHADFHKTYDRVAASFYIRKMFRQLQIYITHCSECQLNRIIRHSFYDALRFIQSPVISFHTVIINFILALSATIESDFDAVMTIMCKFIKRIILIFDKQNWFAEEWTSAFLIEVLNHDWNVSRVIISNKNRKFMSEFWREIFKRLNTKILINIAYHPQIDDQSKRTNQTVKIALHYWIISNFNVDFILDLLYIQANINNFMSTTIGHTSNELCYDFRLKDNLNLFADLSDKKYIKLRLRYREEAKEVIAWINMIIKISYDRKHTWIDLKPGSHAYLRLHHDYIISRLINRKLSNQRVGPFKIIEKINNLAYRLELLPVMKIHFVMSVTQLELKSSNQNLYNRLTSDEPPPVTEEGDDDTEKSYIIERLLERRTSREKTQYLIKWLGYGPAHNVWYDVDDLADAQDLIEDLEKEINRRLGLLRRARKQPPRRTKVNHRNEHELKIKIPQRGRWAFFDDGSCYEY